MLPHISIDNNKSVWKLLVINFGHITSVFKIILANSLNKKQSVTHNMEMCIFR